MNRKTWITLTIVATVLFVATVAYLGYVTDWKFKKNTAVGQ